MANMESSKRKASVESTSHNHGGNLITSENGLQIPISAIDTAQSEEHFQHTPLNLSIDSLRLLKVFPDYDEQGRIKCEVRHTTTADDYTCLSYEWGPQTVMRMVTVNGKACYVGENLWHFLKLASCRTTRHNNLGLSKLAHEESRFRQSLRFEASVGSLWIDALCINQQDAQERNHQVQQMAKIYGSARQVLTWLGNDIKHSSEWFPRIRKRALHAPGDAGLSEFIKCARWFSGNTYWTRAWIIQEILIAKYVFIVCGREAVDLIDAREQLRMQIFNRFYENSTWRNLFNLRLGPFWWGYMRGEIQAPFDFKTSRTDWESWDGSLLKNLALFRGYKCKETRDRIFALLSFTNNAGNIRVDYSSPIADFATTVLGQSVRSFCLCHANLILTTLNLQGTSSAKYFRSFQSKIVTEDASSCQFCGFEVPHRSNCYDRRFQTYACCLRCVHEKRGKLLVVDYGHVVIGGSYGGKETEVRYIPPRSNPASTSRSHLDAETVDMPLWTLGCQFQIEGDDISRLGITLNGLRELAGLRPHAHVNVQDEKRFLDEVCHGTSRIDNLLSSQHGWI